MFLIFILFFVTQSSARILTDEEYSQLPRLFHLDDYEKCLWSPEGVYCLGVFQLTPTHEPHSIYNLMEKHTEGAYNFNRTLIHRGFCLNKRCPSGETNSTLHFEQCANVWAKTRAMRANLRTLHYCRTSKDFRAAIPMSKGQELFIQVLYTIVFLNIVGTAYDLMTGSRPNKIKLLTAWSIPANWHRLTVIHKDGNPQLAALVPVQGAKVLGMLCILYAHNCVYHYAFHVTHPEFLEELPVRSDGLFLSNGSHIVHMFFLLTSFLTTYNMLLYSERKPLNFHMLPIIILKRICSTYLYIPVSTGELRFSQMKMSISQKPLQILTMPIYFNPIMTIIRVSPLYMLVIGYAATWWPHARDGPLVSTTIGKNSQICVRKFWTHAFYVNNIVDREYSCLTPTWYLAVDLQLYAVVCFLTIIMWRHRRRALVMYAALFFGSCVYNAVACYINDWRTLVFLSSPENLRVVFEGVESFSHFYTTPWAALAACFMGMFMAHAQFEIQKNKINCNDYKLAVLLHNLSLPFGVLWVIKSGKVAIELTSSADIAIFIAIERAIFFMNITVLLLGSINIDGPLRKLFAWSRWHAMARMSLAVMLIHWIVGMVIAARPVPYATSVFDVVVDWLATTVITYMLAVPATLLLEIPFQRFTDAVLTPA